MHGQNHIKFPQYSVDYTPTYIGIQHSQQVSILLTEANFNRCKKGTFATCPPDTVVYNAQTLSCESSLFFQTANTYHLCRRKLHFNHQKPFLHRYGTLWVYYFPSPHPITLHCPDLDNRMPRSLSLNGAGLLHNSSGCYITSNEIQLLPELHGTTQAKLDCPKFYLSVNVSIATGHENQQLKDVTRREIQKLDDIRFRVSTPRQKFEIDSLLHVHQTSLFLERRTCWLVTISTSLCAIIILSVFCHLAYSHLHNVHRVPSKPNTRSHAPDNLSEPHEPQHEEQRQDQSGLFASYPLQ